MIPSIPAERMQSHPAIVLRVMTSRALLSTYPLGVSTTYPIDANDWRVHPPIASDISSTIPFPTGRSCPDGSKNGMLSHEIAEHIRRSSRHSISVAQMVLRPFL